MKIKRLDKVLYRDHIAYVHHVSENGFTPTAWLYGLPASVCDTVLLEEPVAFNQLQVLETEIDFTPWIRGEIAIKCFFDTDKELLFKLCDANNIKTANSSVQKYYNNYLFVQNNQLYAKQTIFDVYEYEFCNQQIHDILEYFRLHDRK